jgi:hypothetical protein
MCPRFSFFVILVSMIKLSAIRRQRSRNPAAELPKIRSYGELKTDSYFAPVFPTFFFNRSPA